ncbi:MAG: hypothetical protein GF311_28435 [Candidatus Lokiarchaeota archaeon]|nr:hypothetical protein [Candidatus Lokiarchaeota archaeon]
MSKRFPSDFTLKQLVQNTHAHFKNRFDYKLRDFVGVVKVKSIKFFEVKTGQFGRRYVIETKSFPQYSPYFTPVDSRGRERKKQKSLKHNYEIYIELESLSINSRFRAREGSLKKPVFSASPKVKYREMKKKLKNTKTGFWEWKKIKVPVGVEDDINAKKGVNLDFVYRSMWLWYEEGILYGKNYTNRPPNKTNPHGIKFAGKHMLAVIEYLMMKRILKN